MSEQFCLKWNNYQVSLSSAFKHILEEEDFVDVTLSAQGQSIKGHKVVLSACSTYFKDLLTGISPWQHPVLVLRDVPFNDLQSIVEFVYLGEVNLEQDRLVSFLKTAEVLQIKGLKDWIKAPGAPAASEDVVKPKVEAPDPLDSLETSLDNPHKRSFESESDTASEKRMRLYEEDNMVIDDGSDNDDSVYSGEHIVVAGDPMMDIMNRPPPPPGVKEDLGPLHKRCYVCQMIMLKKNLSRHIRDQHTTERPRSMCPVCQKTYKTADWLKDHIRRGHGYTKEDTDELMSKIKLDNNMNGGQIMILDSSMPRTLASPSPLKVE